MCRPSRRSSRICAKGSLPWPVTLVRVAQVYDVFPTVLSRQNAPEEHWRTKKKKKKKKTRRKKKKKKKRKEDDDDDDDVEEEGSVGCLRGLVEKVEKGRREGR